MIRLSQVCKHYGHTQALAPIDLEIPAGETLAIIGPSGCGKSTLLRLIVGLIQPDAGEIHFERALLSPATVLEARRRMGYVIQEGGLFPHLTVRDNVSVMAHYLGRDRGWIDARLAELARLVGLPAELMPRFPAELSGGQRQRVSLMRALMLDPDLLLLDEPLGALDPMIRYRLQQELKAIFAQLGKTVIMVTHDIAEAAFFGHTLVLMRDGQVVTSGEINELLTRLDLRMAHGRNADAVIQATVHDHDTADQLTELRFGGGRLWVPRVALATGTAGVEPELVGLDPKAASAAEGAVQIGQTAAVDISSGATVTVSARCPTRASGAHTWRSSSPKTFLQRGSSRRRTSSPACRASGWNCWRSSAGSKRSISPRGSRW